MHREGFGLSGSGFGVISPYAQREVYEFTLNTQNKGSDRSVVSDLALEGAMWVSAR